MPFKKSVKWRETFVIFIIHVALTTYNYQIKKIQISKSMCSSKTNFQQNLILMVSFNAQRSRNAEDCNKLAVNRSSVVR